MPCSPARALHLTPSQRLELSKIIGAPSAPQAVVLRCKVVLGAAQGTANKRLARQLVTSLPTVLLWRRRFEEEGLAGVLQDRPRSGRPPQISPQKEAEIVEATRTTKPKNATHWTVRTMARRQGVSPASVQRIWKKYHLQPHRVQHFKFSTDPEFVGKVRDIVGLYLNPPEKALVLSVDEKSQIQALVRTKTDPKTVQALLRHSDVKTTLQLYAHSVSSDRMTAQGEVLQAILGGATPANCGLNAD